MRDDEGRARSSRSALLTRRLRDSGTRRMAKPGGGGGGKEHSDQTGGCNQQCGEKLAKLAPGTPGTMN